MLKGLAIGREALSSDTKLNSASWSQAENSWQWEWFSKHKGSILRGTNQFLYNDTVLWTSHCLYNSVFPYFNRNIRSKQNSTDMRRQLLFHVNQLDTLLKQLLNVKTSFTFTTFSNKNNIIKTPPSLYQYWTNLPSVITHKSHYCTSGVCHTKVTHLDPDQTDKNLPGLKSVGDFLDTVCAAAGGAKAMGFTQSLVSSVLF